MQAARRIIRGYTKAGKSGYSSGNEHVKAKLSAVAGCGHCPLGARGAKPRRQRARRKRRRGAGQKRAFAAGAGAERVCIHFDLDALDPAEIVLAAGWAPAGIKMADAARLINDIAAAKEVCALTIAEPMPRSAINLKAMLGEIALFRE